jgi:hypothetical protein
MPHAATLPPVPVREWLRIGRGRPLLVGPSPVDVHRPPAGDGDAASALAIALRQRAHAVVELQRTILDCGVDLVVAPTAVTTAPALHATGQAYRAAALTAVAVDLTRDAILASGRQAAICGEVVAEAGERARSEARTHVERLAAAAVDAILLRALDLEAAQAIAGFVIGRGMPLLVEIDPTRVTSFVERAAGALPDAFLIGAADPNAILAGSAAARAAAPGVARGARIEVPTEDPQLAVVGAYGALSAEDLALIGAGGRAALEALPALGDAIRAPRVTIPG